MAGIDKIKQEIISSADKKANEILSEAEQKASKIANSAKDENTGQYEQNTGSYFAKSR